MMWYETQMPRYEENSRGGHHLQNLRSRCQNLRFQYRGLVARNMYMKYKSPTTYQSKNMATFKIFDKWVKLQGHKVKHYGTNRKILS
jgi:hypothetical protein